MCPTELALRNVSQEVRYMEARLAALAGRAVRECLTKSNAQPKPDSLSRVMLCQQPVGSARPFSASRDGSWMGREVSLKMGAAELGSTDKSCLWQWLAPPTLAGPPSLPGS